MTDKLTYSKALDYAIEACADNDEIVEKLNALKASIEKKRSQERKPTKTQIANVSVKAAIVDALADGELHVAKEIGETLGFSVPKVSALLKQLVEEGKVERTVDKGRAYFRVVEE